MLRLHFRSVPFGLGGYAFVPICAHVGPLLLLVALGVKEAGIRRTEVLEEEGKLSRHSYTGGSLAHLFHLFREVREARGDQGARHEQRDKTKSFLGL